MHVIGFDSKVLDLNIKLSGLFPKQNLQFGGDFAHQHREPVLRAEDEVIVEVANAARCVSILHPVSIREKLDIYDLSNGKVVSAGLPLSLENDSPRPAFSDGFRVSSGPSPFWTRGQWIPLGVGLP